MSGSFLLRKFGSHFTTAGDHRIEKTEPRPHGGARRRSGRAPPLPRAVSTRILLGILRALHGDFLTFGHRRLRDGALDERGEPRDARSGLAERIARLHGGPVLGHRLRELAGPLV